MDKDELRTITYGNLIQSSIYSNTISNNMPVEIRKIRITNDSTGIVVQSDNNEDFEPCYITNDLLDIANPNMNINEYFRYKYKPENEDLLSGVKLYTLFTDVNKDYIFHILKYSEVIRAYIIYQGSHPNEKDKQDLTNNILHGLYDNLYGDLVILSKTKTTYYFNYYTDKSMVGAFPTIGFEDDKAYIRTIFMGLHGLIKDKYEILL